MFQAIRASVFSFVGALNVLSCIPQTQNLPSWSCGFNLHVVQLVGRFGVIFLSHTLSGVQLWFYFHLYMWVVHWGLAPEAVLEGLGLPLRGPSVELGLQVFWKHQLLKGFGGQGSRKYSALKGYGNQCWPILSSILAWRTPSLTEKSDRLQSQYSSVAQSCPTLCDPMNCCMPGLPVHHQLPEST